MNRVIGRFLWGGLNSLLDEKNEEGYVMIEVRPEGYRDGLCSDILLSRWDMRSMFGTTLIGMPNSAVKRFKILKVILLRG